MHFVSSGSDAYRYPRSRASASSETNDSVRDEDCPYIKSPTPSLLVPLDRAESLSAPPPSARQQTYYWQDCQAAAPDMAAEKKQHRERLKESLPESIS